MATHSMSIWSTITSEREEAMAMKNPPHPGRSVRDNCLEPLGLNVTEAAKVLGCCPSHPIAGIERPRRNFAGHGHPP